jgi:hypothetical protein
MPIRSCLVFAVIAGVIGAFLGYALKHDARSVEAGPSASDAPSAAAPAHRSCEADHTELASTKAQLAICMSYRAPIPETGPSGVPELSKPDVQEFIDPRLPSAEDNQAWWEFKKSDAGTILVRHFDGTLGVYQPDEWPDNGDGVIWLRMLPGQVIGYYAGPDAGPRSDPSAFQPWEPEIPQVTWGREPDGTITINGTPASPSVQRMFGGKVEQPAKPKQEDAP